MEWLVSKDVRFSQNDVNCAAVTGRLDVLEWMLQFELLPDTKMDLEISRKGFIQILEWINRHRRLNCLLILYRLDITDDLNIDVLQWLARRIVTKTPFEQDILKYYLNNINEDFKRQTAIKKLISLQY
jgi:hypothetical protein